MRRFLRAIAGFSAAVVVVAGLSGLATAPPANAADAAKTVNAAKAANAALFQPGYIISDEIFFRGSMMTEQQVQAFLESKVPRCAATAGNPGCLRDYRTDSSPRAADAWCSAYAGGTNELASRVLVRVALACNINPQVLLVLLQKEQGLITATNPSATKYRIATGYGCPDTAPCDALYFGFANQVYSAARQFVRYGDPSLGFRYRAGRDNTVQWHPNAGCGSSTFRIENRATAALYNYTPYRPNQAALNNLYGLGDSCSSYGNRNFWAYFTDWFGSPIVTADANAFVRALYVDVLGREPSDEERLGWGKALMGGMPASQVAGGFVNSDEFRLLKIDAAYREVLGREPEEAGRMSWLNGMRVGTLAPDDTYRIFLQSQEYYNLAGGTDDSFVAAVYEKILGRVAEQSERDYWVGVMEQNGRSSVVNLIWSSVETARARVAVMYETYLGREPDAAGLSQWGDYALRYGDTWVRSAILGSAEYWNRATQRYP